jgi:hypothetical protein
MVLAEENRSMVKDSAAELSKRSWKTITPDNILDAWDINDVRTKLNRAGSLTEDNSRRKRSA